MTLSELIEELQFHQERYGDNIKVRVEADHAQVPMSASWVGIGYISDDVYLPESVHEDDVEDVDVSEVIIIQAY